MAKVAIMTPHRRARMTTRGYRYPRTRRPYRRRKNVMTRRRKTFVSPISRLRGVVPQPYFKYSRCIDYTPVELKVANHIQAGLWSVVLQVKPVDINGFSTLAGIYRWFRIKSITVEYTPSARTDDYAKQFENPLGVASHYPYSWGGGGLELKFLKYDGYANLVSNWTEALNRAGQLKKLITVKSFRKKFTPHVQQLIQDMPTGIDPTKSIRSPWLSTLIPNHEQMEHFIGQECYHTLNNTSFDNALPLKISRRIVYEIEFKGMKL